MSYGDSRGFPSRTASNKVLRDHAFNIAKNPKLVDIKEVWLQWFINLFIKTCGDDIY